jgi:hypothetical protein
LSLFDPALNNDVLIAAITGVEIVAAITRRARGGSISATDATAACNQFDDFQGLMPLNRSCAALNASCITD